MVFVFEVRDKRFGREVKDGRFDHGMEGTPMGNGCGIGPTLLLWCLCQKCRGPESGQKILSSNNGCKKSVLGVTSNKDQKNTRS